MTKTEIIKLLRREIWWCVWDPFRINSETMNYRRGYLAGLKAALRLITMRPKEVPTMACKTSGKKKK